MLRRQRLRLRAYDYAQPGAYFVTVCSEGRVHLFGRVDGGRMLLNDLGRIVADCWSDLPRHYHHVLLDAFVVRPNHVHGIIILRGYDEGADADADNRDTAVGAGLRPAQAMNNDDAVDGIGDNPGRAGLRPAPTANNNIADDISDDIADTTVGAGLRPARPSMNHDANADDANQDEPRRAGLRAAPLGGRPAPTAKNDDVADAAAVALKRHALPEIMRAFKSFSARRINEFRHTPSGRVWQRNYYEHVVRTETDLAQIHAYVRDNPARWASDIYYLPAARAGRPA